MEKLLDMLLEDNNQREDTDESVKDITFRGSKTHVNIIENECNCILERKLKINYAKYNLKHKLIEKGMID